MSQRMLDKSTQPTVEQVQAHMGQEAYANLNLLEKQLMKDYDLHKTLKFPFGNTYGWGYKFAHKQAHLCYAFFEQHQFTVMLQLGDACVKEMEVLIPSLSNEVQVLWKNRYPCGEQGGWIHMPIKTEQDVNEIRQLIHIKKHVKKE